MHWPAKLINQFDEALQDVTLADGYDKDHAIVALLESPYTPIGSMTCEGLGGGFVSFTLHGDVWGRALDGLKAFVGANADAIVAAYKESAVPYDDLTG